MAFLTQNQVRAIVIQALRIVADFSGEIDDFEFRNFHQFHKESFLINLKLFLNESPYYDRYGNTDFERYYDVPLSMNVLNSWTTILDCINYMYDYQLVKKKDPNKIRLNES